MSTVKQLARQFLPPAAQRIFRIFLRRCRMWSRPHRFRFSGASDRIHGSPFRFIVDKNNLLEALGVKHQPTKQIQNFLPYYWMHFRDIRLDVRSVLEIGVETGRSLRMWEEFFPNAIIHGIDIDPACQGLEGERRRIFIGDQCDPRFLEEVIRAASGPFDIVIDDGSHRTADQLTTFDRLFPAMSAHGIYVIEDTGMGGDLRTVNSMKTIVDHVMYWPPGYPPRDWPYLNRLPDDARWLAKHVIGLAFYRWIIFVMRGRNPEDNAFLSEKQISG